MSFGRCPSCGSEITTGHACSRETPSITPSTGLPLIPWQDVSGVAVKLCHHSGALTCATCSGETIAALRSRIAELEERLAKAERERDAYKRAKAENDDRFMVERDEALAERDAARTTIERLRHYANHTNKRIAALARFGALVAKECFSGDFGGLDGGDAQDMAIRAGVLVLHEGEPHEDCEACADGGPCYVIPDRPVNVFAAVESLALELAEEEER